jgi:hypothetical protein
MPSRRRLYAGSQPAARPRLMAVLLAGGTLVLVGGGVVAATPRPAMAANVTAPGRLAVRAEAGVQAAQSRPVVTHSVKHDHSPHS